MTASPFTLGMVQQATYWSPGANDGFGGIAYDPPVVISCRWEEKATQFRSADGELLTSESVVYADRQLEFKGLLLEGDHLGDTDYLDPRRMVTAEGKRPREIRGLNASPSISNTLVLHKVYL